MLLAMEVSLDTSAEVGQNSADGTRLYIWNGETFDLIWADVEQLLLLDRRWEEYYTLEAFQDLGKQQDVYTWTVHDDGGAVAMVMMQLEVWPVMTTMRYHWMAAIPGKGIRAVRKYREFLELWAKRLGACRIEFVGRPEWAPLLFNDDYKLHSVLLVRDLSDIKEH